MGSPSLMIILILVVWIIVLAPLMIGNNKPIRRSGDGYDETRVLHEGGTAPMAERRRPKLTAADIHRHSEDTDYEVVEATDAEEQVLIDDAPALRTLFRRPGAEDQADHIEGEVIEHVEDEAEAAEAHERTERPRIAQGLPLQAYSDDQLDDLMAWIRSDGVNRSEAGEVEELRSALALRRRGSGIDAVLANAVRRTR